MTQTYIIEAFGAALPEVGRAGLNSGIYPPIYFRINELGPSGLESHTARLRPSEGADAPCCVCR